MDLVELFGPIIVAPPRPLPGPTRSPEDVAAADRAARRSLRRQIAKLEREFADAFVTAYPMGGFEMPAGTHAEPRLLDLAELEQARDDLAERVRAARVLITERGDEQAENRLLLERMLLEPGKYRFSRVSRNDLGEGGCGVWQVRPRLGLIGMLMGWWQVVLSSGCPLPTGRGLAVAARSASKPRLTGRPRVIRLPRPA